MNRPKVKISIGRCIYCGATEGKLTDEHWFPFGLGGKDVLEKASCGRCQRTINKRFEARLLSGEFANFRHRQGMTSRKNGQAKGRPETFTDLLGRQFTVSASEAPTYVPIYHFQQPGVLAGRLPFLDGSAATWTEIVTSGWDEFKRKHPLWNEAIGITFRPADIARLIAKIAYGQVVATFGLGGLRPLCLAVIVGDISPLQLVGSAARDEARNGPFHYHGIMLNDERSLLIVDYDFFSPNKGFSYRIVIGIVDHADVASEAFRSACRLTGTPRPDADTKEALCRHLNQLGLVAPF